MSPDDVTNSITVLIRRGDSQRALFGLRADEGSARMVRRADGQAGEGHEPFAAAAWMSLALRYGNDTNGHIYRPDHGAGAPYDLRGTGLRHFRLSYPYSRWHLLDRRSTAHATPVSRGSARTTGRPRGESEERSVREGRRRRHSQQ